MTNKTSVHEEVQKHYGDVARSFRPSGSTASCCGPASASSCCEPNSSALYDASEIADLPDSVTGLSLGCGDPVAIASLKPGETVLDLGSGAGIDCFLAARQVGPQGRVIGVDMTPAMLEKANANKAKMNAENVEFREGVIEALPVDDASIDVIMSNCVINLSPDKAAVFHEAYRVLKPGGRATISDVVTEGEISPEYRKRMDLWAGCVAGALDLNLYMGMMREAGFVDVEVHDKAESTDEVVNTLPHAPRVYSARITGRKPLASA